MSGRRHLTTLLGYELRDEARAGEIVTVVLPFGAVALLTIPMAIGIETQLLSRIGPGIFWTIVFLFGIVVTQRQSAVSSPALRDTIRLLGVDPAVHQPHQTSGVLHHPGIVRREDEGDALLVVEAGHDAQQLL